MSAGDGNGNGYNYGRARVAAALILIVLTAGLAILDALSPTYSLDSIQLGLFLGTAMVLLSVEAGKRLIR